MKCLPCVKEALTVLLDTNNSSSLMFVCVKVSVGNVSRGSKGGRPTSSSSAPPSLPLPFLIFGHESHLCCWVCHRTTATCHGSLSPRCASSTTTHTGKMNVLTHVCVGMERVLLYPAQRVAHLIKSVLRKNRRTQITF